VLVPISTHPSDVCLKGMHNRKKLHIKKKISLGKSVLRRKDMYCIEGKECISIEWYVFTV
jgi:hypothetical protein